MKKLLALLLLTPFVYSDERDINKAWCFDFGGNDQFRTKDGTYVDCLTDEYAIEAEYDNKWKESIGQSLHYAEATNKKPGILIIKRSSSKKDYLEELNKTIIKFNLPITVFSINEHAIE